MNKYNPAQDEIVEFQKDRDFGDMIGAPFYFLKQEFKPFMKAIFRYAGPFLAVGLLAIMIFANSIYKNVMNKADFLPSTLIYVAVFGLFFLIAFLMASVISYSYIRLYVERGKDNFTVEEVWETAKPKFFRVLGAQIIVGIIVIIGFFLFYIPGIYLAVALVFVPISIIYEDCSIGEALSRSFKIIKQNWWSTFGIILVFGMIIGFASYIFIIPIYIIILTPIVTGSSIGIGSFIGIIISIVLYFTAYLFFISLQQVLIGFQFFKLKYKKEGVGLMDRIYDINVDNEPAIFKDADTGTEDDVEPEIEDKDDYSNITDEKIDKKDEEEKKEDEKNRFEDLDDDYDRFKPKY